MSEVKMLCIGQCCHDRTNDGYILGGTVSYSALVARQLGCNVSIVTSVGDDFQFLDQFWRKDIPIYNLCAERTTEFANIYENDIRTQYMFNRANSISAPDLPKDVMQAEIVFIGTIADELDLEILDLFDDQFIAGALQGNLRSWDADGKVVAKDMDYSKLSGFDVLLFSEDDLKGLNNALLQIRKYVDHVVITQGKKGATIYHGNKSLHFPAYPTHEIDATGAGDTFATAYAIEFFKTRDIKTAAIYAHCAASIIIEHEGLSELPTDEAIRKRIETFQAESS